MRTSDNAMHTDAKKHSEERATFFGADYGNVSIERNE